MHSRIRHLIIVPAFIALLVAGCDLAKYDFSHIAPIENVEIEGQFENISPEGFRETVIAVIDAGYFALDLDVVRSTLMMLPWVDDISVRRQWPSTLHINVTEKRAVAYWNDDAMISDRGEIFRPEVINNKLMMPKLKGPEGLHKNMWLFLSEVNKSFLSMGFKIVDINMDDRRAWNLHFLAKNSLEKIELKLGRDNADNRFTRFVRVFSNMDKFNFNSIAVIDLRYPNGFAMRIKNNNKANKKTVVREA